MTKNLYTFRHLIGRMWSCGEALVRPQTQFQKDGTENGQYKHVHDLLYSFPELNGEIQAYIDRQNVSKPVRIEQPGEAIKLGNKQTNKSESAAVRSLLSMKRGELSEASEEEQDFREGIATLRKAIYDQIVGVASHQSGIG